MTKWKLTDAYEIGYEYECPVCGRHIGVKFKGKDLPDECPYCGSKMTEITKEDAINHFKYGVSHDIFSEPVTTFAKMAITALREQDTKHSEAVTKWISVKDKLPKPFVSVLVYMPGEQPLPTVHEGYVAGNGRWYAHFFEREAFEVTHWMPLPEPPKEDT